MDTKSLVVGQGVYINSGRYGNEGKVVEIGSGGVRAETDDGGLFFFDKDGKGSDGQRTYECGLWYIDEMAYAERKALNEKAAQRFRKWHSVDCEHKEKQPYGTHYYIEKCLICGCENPNYNPDNPKGGYRFMMSY